MRMAYPTRILAPLFGMFSLRSKPHLRKLGSNNHESNRNEVAPWGREQARSIIDMGLRRHRRDMPRFRRNECVGSPPQSNLDGSGDSNGSGFRYADQGGSVWRAESSE